MNRQHEWFLGLIHVSAVLDPRISYEGLKTDYADDETLDEHLEKSKTDLFEYYYKNYANKAVPAPQATGIATTTMTVPSTSHSPKKSFTDRYRKKGKAVIDELSEYFKLPTEDFERCNPIQWWVGRRAQFPNLFRLACDILCIPGR